MPMTRSGHTLAWLALATFGSAAALAAPVKDVSVSLSTDQTLVDATQDVVVQVSFTNNANHPVHLLRWYTPADEVEDAIFTITRDGTRLPYLGAHYKRPAPTGKDYLKLAPGETLTRSVELSALYDLSETGAYSIRYAVGAVGLVDDKSASEGGRRGVDELASNRVDLWIQGRAFKVAQKGPPGGGACSNSQVTALKTAQTDAATYSSGAQSYLAGSARTSQRFSKWFGPVTASSWNTAQSHFAAISGALPQLTFNCSCKKSYYAYVYPTQPYVVYPCNAFWSAPAKGTDSKAGTLIHETSHFTNVASTDDWAYGQTAAASLAISDPAKALDNADSHEYFGENTPALP
jgi:peptidyl-Lys metalloendopeptidase